MKKIIITIDGHSACGKSTLAKALANELNYGYIDTGAMYRAVTFYFLENRVNIQRTAEMEKALKRINITFKNTVGGNRTYLNGKDVEDVIRKMFVSKNVSHVAAISTVRKMIVKQQVEMGKLKGIVMEGRDIGTVVFPNAKLKIFLTADEDVRTKRRYDELLRNGQKVSMKSIKDNLLERDRIDSTRKDSPLKKAKEAILIDNSNLTQREQLEMVLALSKERIRRLSVLDKKVIATTPKIEHQKNTRPTPSKRINQPVAKNQNPQPKNTKQNQPNKKAVAQNTKSNQPKRTNQPALRNQKTETRSTQQNQPSKKIAAQNTKPNPTKRTSQPASKKQKAETRNTQQNQSNKKVAGKNTKPNSTKRTNQPATKNQKVEPRNSRLNQSNKKVAGKNTKSNPTETTDQPISQDQKAAQQEFLKIQVDDKPVERKTKPTPKRKAKHPVKKVVQKKPTPTAKKKLKKPVPKPQQKKQNATQQKPTGDPSTQPKKKKVRTKRPNKK